MNRLALILAWGMLAAGAAAATPSTAPAPAAELPMHLLRPEPLPVKSVGPEDPKIARPTTAIPAADCTNGGCHAGVKSFKFIHGPVNVNACDACHKLADAKQHHFEMLRQKADLCTFCHENRKPDQAFVHKPVAQGDCLGCHNPHGGETKRFLYGKTIAELCNRCHQDVVADRKFVHKPAAIGQCDTCHEAHSSKFPKLVNAQGSALCFTCHTQMKAQVASARFVHKPINDKGCQECHEVHASNHARQLKMEPLQLCESCHQPIKQIVTTASFKHSPATTGQACLTCHAPHGGQRAKLMRDEPAKVCLSCHDKSIDTKLANGSTQQVVPAMASIMDPKLYRHGPLRDGECSGCHAPHGGQFSRLLVKNYSNRLYEPFSLEKYDLCFSCHDKQLVLQRKTTGLTNFRNGDENLHYLHVNKDEKGRSCAACHATHASKQPLHLVETVQFGKWNMPVSFAQTSTGGSCAPGCHAPMTYDRANAVKYPPHGPDPLKVLPVPPRPAIASPASVAANQAIEEKRK